jgi:hypothetical protein
MVRWFEKIFDSIKMQATAVDFDQLLEMVAVGFPKMKFGFLPLIRKT